MEVDALRAALTDLGLSADDLGDGRVMTTVDGRWRRSMPVLLTLEERHLRVTALLCGAVEQGHAAVYRHLLARNERAGDVRFAVDGDGDVLLVGRLPRGHVDAAVLDELLGELVTTADETFNVVLGTGFAAYVEREQRWRAASGQPDNPAFPAPDTTVTPGDQEAP